jgi:hypothetical protein
MAHGDITRQDWKVVYNRARGFGQAVEWFQNRENIDSSWIVRKGLEIVSISLETHVLDY